MVCNRRTDKRSATCIMHALVCEEGEKGEEGKEGEDERRQTGWGGVVRD